MFSKSSGVSPACRKELQTAALTCACWPQSGLSVEQRYLLTGWSLGVLCGISLVPTTFEVSWVRHLGGECLSACTCCKRRRLPLKKFEIEDDVPSRHSDASSQGR